MSQLTLVSFPCPVSSECCLFLAASYLACQKGHDESLIDLWSLFPGADLKNFLFFFKKTKKHILGEMNNWGAMQV